MADRVYFYFESDQGMRKGSIEATLEGPQRPVGKFIDLTSPALNHPWVGRNRQRAAIDGPALPEGRPDFL